jgi:hypothetical protein
VAILSSVGIGDVADLPEAAPLGRSCAMQAARVCDARIGVGIAAAMSSAGSRRSSRALRARYGGDNRG